MSKGREWYENLSSYTEIVAIEFARDGDVLPVMEYLGCNLRPCPYNLIAPDVIIVPKESIELLPLGQVPHQEVELRDMFAVRSVVCGEITRRWRANQEPHYYVSRHMVEPPDAELAKLLQLAGRPAPTEPREMKTVYRMYVRLSTVHQIEEALAHESI